jgi:hypothetical protein
MNPKTAQELARHSDVRLTLQRYTRKTLHDLGAAVNSLPSVMPSGQAAAKREQRATGTEKLPRRLEI